MWTGWLTGDGNLASRVLALDARWWLNGSCLAMVCWYMPDVCTSSMASCVPQPPACRAQHDSGSCNIQGFCIAVAFSINMAGCSCQTLGSAMTGNMSIWPARLHAIWSWAILLCMHGLALAFSVLKLSPITSLEPAKLVSGPATCSPHQTS